MADTAFSYEAKAVMTTQIISGQRACASCTRSTPDMPSMRMSVSSRSALLSSSALIAVSALSTPTGWQPIIFRPSISVLTIPGSSSATRTRSMWDSL